MTDDRIAGAEYAYTWMQNPWHAINYVYAMFAVRLIQEGR